MDCCTYTVYYQGKPWMVARVLLLMSAGLRALPRPPGDRLSRAPLETHTSLDGWRRLGKLLAEVRILTLERTGRRPSAPG